MKALILAAGVGKRLWPVTKERPKCMIEIGGQTLLSRLLDSLQKVGVTHAVLVVGHLKEKIIEKIGDTYKTLRVSYIVNEQYAKGSILSLWMARDEFDDDLLIMDADVLFPATLLLRLVQSPHANCLLMDETAQSHGEEMMLMAQEERVISITRHLSGRFDRAGEGVGFLKVSKQAAPLLKEILTHFIAEGKDNAEYEDALALFLQKVEVGYETVGGLPWTEIDFTEDIRRAEREILPRMNPF